MKPGLHTGDVKTLEVVVTEAMAPGANGWLIAGEPCHTVHPLYSTAAMLTHMEWTARQHLLPYLEAGEESAGTAIDLRHTAPTPVGATVRIQSTLTHLEPRGDQVRLVSAIEAWQLNGAAETETAIGSATFTQVILPAHRLTAKADQWISPAMDDTTLVCPETGNRFSLHFKGLAHPFPCTRYDEWVVTRAAVTDATQRHTEEGPFLLRFEIQEIITVLRDLMAGKRKDYQSDFLERILQITAETENEQVLLTIQIKPVGASPFPPVALRVGAEQLTPFCHALEAEYLTGTELPAASH
ncbi:MAG: thioesterase family protein [Candidatus Melainabacteria bacterium]